MGDVYADTGFVGPAPAPTSSGNFLTQHWKAWAVSLVAAAVAGYFTWDKSWTMFGGVTLLVLAVVYLAAFFALGW